MKYAWILSILLVTLLFFQNCAVYKSQGLTQFEQNLGAAAVATSCQPYIDVNSVCTYIGCHMAPNDHVNVSVTQAVGGATDVQCNFTPTNVGIKAQYPSIVCDVNESDAGMAARVADFTAASCAGDASTANCQQLFTNNISVFASFLTYIPEPPSDPYNATSLGKVEPFNGNAFAVFYSQTDPTTQQTTYAIKYIAAQSGANFGASCTLAFFSPTLAADSSYPTKLAALAMITEQMAVNAANRLH